MSEVQAARLKCSMGTLFLRLPDMFEYAPLYSLRFPAYPWPIAVIRLDEIGLGGARWRMAACWGERKPSRVSCTPPRRGSCVCTV